MKNLHAITDRPRLADLLADAPLPQWQEDYLRRYSRANTIFPGSTAIEGYFLRPVGEGDALDPLMRRETIANRLARRVAELRYNNRRVEGLALVLTRTEYDAYRDWLLENRYIWRGDDQMSPDTFEGIPLMVR